MSASRNADAAAGQPGQIGSHVPRDEPMTTHGHQPGKLTGNDAVPEFHAQTLPPGTAPTENTFEPQTGNNAPGGLSNAEEGNEDGTMQTSASDTLSGATSGEVHTGLGKPLRGQTGTELQHDGVHKREKQTQGLAGLGVGGTASGNQAADARTQPSQRAIGKEEGVLAGQRAGSGADKPSAEEREPVTADQL